MLKFTILVACAFVAVSASPAFAQEGGYAYPFSVTKGDTIRFHISTAIPKYDLVIRRIPPRNAPVKTAFGLSGVVYPVPDSAYYYGCAWPVSYEFQIPDTWLSGVYTAEFPTSTGTNSIGFVVREKQPGALSKILVTLNASTWEAYNSFGGKSLYDHNSSDKKRSSRVSFERPVVMQYYWYELAAWLQKENRAAEYIMNTDLDRFPSILDHYNVLVVVGHDEYWTNAARTAAERFLAAGKRIIILGGNTCWWQTRIDDSARALVCFKDATLDPLFHKANGRVTDLWSGTTVNNPENKLTGVSWRNGGYVNGYSYGDTLLPAGSGFGDYAAWNTHHWLFAGTGLSDGELFGTAAAIVGYEVDGALFSWKNGLPTVTGIDSTPTSFRILGLSPAMMSKNHPNEHHATMGLYQLPTGGAVFNAATTNWVYGLRNDSTVQRITRNVFDRFLGGPLPPDIISWNPFHVVSDTVHGERVHFCSRNVTVNPNAATPFSVSVANVNGTPIRYVWTINGDSVSGNTSMVLVPAMARRYVNLTIGVSVMSAHDTTGITWSVFCRPLKIVSQPKQGTLKPLIPYRYNVAVSNIYNDSVRYNLLSAPPWMSLNAAGVLTGIIPNMRGTYDISVRAADAHGDLDTQTYAIVVGKPTDPSEANTIPVDARLESFPNPFSRSTTLDYTLTREGTVTLEIYSATGQRVRMLCRTSFSGRETLRTVWDGTNDIGTKLESGVYFVLMKALLRDNQQSIIIKRPMLLLR